eukprot:3457327-Rhodomonas_salina.2
MANKSCAESKKSAGETRTDDAMSYLAETVERKATRGIQLECLRVEALCRKVAEMNLWVGRQTRA